MKRSSGDSTARSSAMLRSSFLALLLLGLLLLPSPALARTAGVSASDSVVFDYTIFTTYATPNGNQSSTWLNQMSISIDSVSTSSALGEIQYTETINILNGTSVESPSAVSNVTAIFDPYDNRTYLGTIGFYPFTYTDLATGSAENLSVTLTITGTGTGDITGTQHVSSMVAKAPGYILINFTISSGSELPPALTVMRYNATTGVLIKGVTYTHYFGIEKIFTYDLVSYHHVPSPDYTFVYFGLAAIIAIVAVVAILRRPSKRNRKADRMRRKFGRTVPLHEGLVI
jgi:hypothetical protein